MPVSINSGANEINLAKAASPKVVERFKLESVVDGIFSHDYSWKGVRTVEVRSIDTVPLQDYNETKTDGTSRYGNMYEVGDTVQEMTVVPHKSIWGTIDKSNNDSVLQTKSAGRFLKRETDEVIIPYVDKFCLTRLAEKAGLGHFMGSTTLDYTNIVKQIFLANAKMSNAKVPKKGRVLYMGETLAVELKLSTQVIGIDKLGEKAIVNGVMGKISDCQVRLVPDDYLPTGVHFMIVKTGCACAPKKINDFRILDGGWMINGKMVVGDLLHDCFVFNAKRQGILVCMDAPYSVEAGTNFNLDNGSTKQLAPTMKLVSGGDDIDATYCATYASGTATSASVSATGLVTALKGTGNSSVITVTVGTASDTVTCTCITPA